MVWIDLEMTGLDPETCGIIEIATVITDSELNVLAHGPELVIHQPQSMLDAMDEWNTSHHGESGLTAAVQASTIDTAEAERLTLEFVAQHCAKRSAVLCGNSIWQDRRFLAKYMPQLEQYLHYRCIDVSSLKELRRRWRPDLKPPEKAGAHRALGDILESVAELAYYREHLLASAPAKDA